MPSATLCPAIPAPSSLVHARAIRQPVQSVRPCLVPAPVRPCPCRARAFLPTARVPRPHRHPRHPSVLTCAARPAPELIHARALIYAVPCHSLITRPTCPPACPHTCISYDEATPCHPHQPPSFAGHWSCPCHPPCCAQPFQPHPASFTPVPSASPCSPSDHALSQPRFVLAHAVPVPSSQLPASTPSSSSTPSVRPHLCRSPCA